MANVKIGGKVYFAGVNRDNEKQFQILLEINDEKISKLNSLIKDFDSYNFTPVKMGSDENPRTKGKIFFKASSIYDVPVYDENGNETDGYDLTEMGQGSDVTLFVNIKETKYKGKKGLVAYLSKIRVNDFIEREPFNPFENDDDEI